LDAFVGFWYFGIVFSLCCEQDRQRHAAQIVTFDGASLRMMRRRFTLFVAWPLDDVAYVHTFSIDSWNER
jgi:hypothetical protein